MSKSPYCKLCNKYHFDRESYYDRDLHETIMFCSRKHKQEYIEKKKNPSFKTSQDKFMDEYNRELQERKEARRARWDETMREMGYDEDSSSQSSQDDEARKAQMEELNTYLDGIQKQNKRREKEREERELEIAKRRKALEEEERARVRAMGIPTPETDSIPDSTVKLRIKTDFEKYTYQIARRITRMREPDTVSEITITPLHDGYQTNWEQKIRKYKDPDATVDESDEGYSRVCKEAKSIIYQYTPKKTDYSIRVSVRAFLTSDKEKYSFQSNSIYFEGPGYEAERLRLIEEEKQKDLATIEENQKDAHFLKKYGTILVASMAFFFGFLMLKNGGDNGVAKIAFIALFFTIYQGLILALPLFDKEEIKKLKAKHKYQEPKNPGWLKAINLMLIVLFYSLSGLAIWYLNQQAKDGSANQEWEMIQSEGSSDTNTDAYIDDELQESMEALDEELSDEIQDILDREAQYLDSISNSIDALLEDAAEDAAIMEPYSVVDFYDGYTIVVAEPTINSEVIREIAHGEEVVVLQKQDPWWKVELADASIGYIHKSRLIEGDLTPTPPWEKEGMEKDEYEYLKEQGYYQRPYLGD